VLARVGGAQWIQILRVRNKNGSVILQRGSLLTEIRPAERITACPYVSITSFTTEKKVERVDSPFGWKRSRSEKYPLKRDAKTEKISTTDEENKIDSSIGFQLSDYNNATQFEQHY
jgi:hypothetical protein